MNKLLVAGIVGVLAGLAGAQSTHQAEIYMVGPSEVMPNTTYTIEAWGTWDSPLFVQDMSAMAGFGVDAINVFGNDQIASVGNVQISPWAAGFGVPGHIIDLSIRGISGGQLANLFGFLNPFIDMRNPIKLFSFEFTTADVPVTHIGFAPANPSPNGGLSFYPLSMDGASVIAPNHADTSLTLTGWEYFVPAPGAILGLGTLLVCARRRR